MAREGAELAFGAEEFVVFVVFVVVLVDNVINKNGNNISPLHCLFILLGGIIYSFTVLSVHFHRCRGFAFML